MLIIQFYSDKFMTLFLQIYDFILQVFFLMSY